MPIQKMNTNPSPNPKLAFYKLLYQFFTAPEFIPIVAEELVRQRALQNTGITCPDFDLNDLELIHQERHGFNRPRYDDFTVSMVDAFFRDMSLQLRTEEVQDLVCKYGSLEPYENMLMIRVERLKPYGNGKAAKMTITVNDWRLFFEQMNFQLPDEVWGEETHRVRDEVLWSCASHIAEQLSIPQHYSIEASSQA
jgi:hypothetical protein